MRTARIKGEPINPHRQFTEEGRRGFIRTLGEPRRTASMVEKRSRFRRWAVQLNDGIEAWMETVNWRRLDRALSNLAALAVTGAVLYLLCVLCDAWLQGRFNLGGQ